MDPLIKSQLLYQLSYAPTECFRSGADIPSVPPLVDTLRPEMLEFKPVRHGG